MTLVAVGQRCQALHVGAWSVARVEMVSCTVGTRGVQKVLQLGMIM